MLNLAGIDAQVQIAHQAGFGALEHIESLAAHDAPRPAVADAEDDAAAALVGQGCAVADQVIKLEGVLGLFELQVLIFRGVHPGLQLLQFGLHRGSCG